MKVKIEFTVEVDEHMWEVTYGCPPEAVRQDAIDLARGMVEEQFRYLGLLKE